jgi:hypothetical protein
MYDMISFKVYDFILYFIRKIKPLPLDTMAADPARPRQGPLVSVTGERERPPLRYLNRLKEVAVLQVI